MAEQDQKTPDFALEDFKLKPISSTENAKGKHAAEAEASSDEQTESNEAKPLGGEAATVEQDEPAEIEDPIFKELSAPKLPELPKENRARLQMQSPNKVYFYWSFRENPFKILNRVFGGQTGYQLVAKLLNQTSAREEIFPIDTEGSAWFDVDADAGYQVEIGFYAVNRPFVRVLFSNALRTPRKNPSPRQDYSEYFAVSADRFAKVLDVSGFQQDAFEVALAGDDIEAADRATETAFSQIFDAERDEDFDANQASEMRFVLLALASGYALEELRAQINQSLYKFLQSRADRLSAEKALAALRENFGVSTDEVYEEETFSGTVYGASLVSFPRSVKRRTLPKFTPLSSLHPVS